MDEVRVGQLAGCLDALQSGITTVLDHFNATITPAHADAALDATLQSGARVIWCPARHSAPTQVFPSLEFEAEQDTLKWQLSKLQEWSERLSQDERVTLGLGQVD